MSAAQLPISSTLPPPRKMKFMFFPMGSVIAHVSHALQTARVLRERGHTVVFAGTNVDHPQSRLGIVAQDGFQFVHAQEFNFARVWDKLLQRGTIGLYNEISNVKRWAPIEDIIESQVAAIHAEKPDAVVGAATITLSSAAYVAGVPALNIHNAYLLDFILSRRYRRYWWYGFDAYHLAPMRRRVYKRHGKKPVSATELFRSVPLLSPDLPGLYDTCSFLSNVHQVGPILFDYPAALPDWMDELSDGTPNVYITMGSTGRFDLFLRNAYTHLEKLPYRFVVTTGGQISNATLHAAPKNFRFAKYAPGTQLLTHCSAIVFHGGNGTMYQALAAGVPMLAVPSHIEQVLSSNIGIRHGFCTRLSRRKAATSALARGIRELVENSARREAALQFAPRVREHDGAVNAANHCERVAAAGVPAGAAWD